MMDTSFQRIAVVGLGLIGGSLVKRIRGNAPKCKLIGVDSRAILAAAREHLDETFEPENLAAAVRDADLIFLATPINTILQQLPEVARSIRRGAVATDVGSTKSLIVAEAQKHFTGERFFIGGHPLAGREKGGWENARADLFESAAYVLTPQSNFPAPLSEALTQLLQTLGARVIKLEPATHDRLVADISHLPQLLAVALMNFVARDNASPELALQLAGGGFRDMTRLAASPFAIWQNILDSNHANVRRSLQDFIIALQRLAQAIDRDELEELFQQANQLRKNLAARR
jgi:prephenate dehydrogenase